MECGVPKPSPLPNVRVDERAQIRIGLCVRVNELLDQLLKGLEAEIPLKQEAHTAL